MPDEPSLGEVSRRLDRAERDWATELARVRAEHETDIKRLEREHAEDTVRLEREHNDDLRSLREDVIKPLQDRLRMSFGRWVGVLGVVAAFAGVIVTAWATSKGTH